MLLAAETVCMQKNRQAPQNSTTQKFDSKSVRKAALMMTLLSGAFLAQQIFWQIPRWLEKKLDPHRNRELVASGIVTAGAGSLFIGSLYILVRPGACFKESQVCDPDDFDPKIFTPVNSGLQGAQGCQV